MSSHLISDPTTPPTASDASATAAGWARLSAALTEEVPTLADREDLLVSIAPGAGKGAPACFLPAHATIEVDGVHLNGIDPATVQPHLVSDRARYAVAWGLLTHECAHARHSRWSITPDKPANTPTQSGTPPQVARAALLLEESRIEGAHIRRRPDDRHWLRASATSLILADTKAADPASAPAMTAADAATSAGLLLARVDAGILTRAEVAQVAVQVEAVLGAATLETLRRLWRQAHTVADDDHVSMLDLGRQWCAALGQNTQDPTTPAGATATPRPHQPQESSTASTAPGTGAAEPSPLTRAITDAVASIAANVAAEPVPADPAATRAAAQAAEQQATATAKTAAHQVFTGSGPRTGRTETAGTRTPTTAERAAARRLGRALTTAGIRDRTTVKTTSALPPGRLRMRGALAADAQRAAGALPTAEPFTRTTRRTVPAPPLRLGIACDVSGSMNPFADPVASAAWILAHAAAHCATEASTATVIFGNHVRALTRPGTAPARVARFEARDNWEDIPGAIDALDGALELSRPGAARLLVIVSDGKFRTTPRREGQARIDRLRAVGCGILWLVPAASRTNPLNGATVHKLSDPTTTAQAIGRAATTALRVTR